MAIDMTFIYRFRARDNEKKVGREKEGKREGEEGGAGNGKGSGESWV